MKKKSLIGREARPEPQLSPCTETRVKASPPAGRHRETSRPLPSFRISINASRLGVKRCAEVVPYACHLVYIVSGMPGQVAALCKHETRQVASRTARTHLPAVETRISRTQSCLRSCVAKSQVLQKTGHGTPKNAKRRSWKSLRRSSCIALLVFSLRCRL